MKTNTLVLVLALTRILNVSADMWHWTLTDELEFCNQTLSQQENDKSLKAHCDGIQKWKIQHEQVELGCNRLFDKKYKYCTHLQGITSQPLNKDCDDVIEKWNDNWWKSFSWFGAVCAAIVLFTLACFKSGLV
jgi:hypothetical protein